MGPLLSMKVHYLVLFKCSLSVNQLGQLEFRAEHAFSQAAIRAQHFMKLWLHEVHERYKIKLSIA